MADLKTIESLLSEAREQLDLQRQHQRETGDAFNIFTVLDRERKEESTHCRLMYELLNPEGSHGCGDQFLQRFFQDVLGEEYREGTRVYREKNIDDGRIDLVIEGESCYYPIEVKIDAGDQDRQIKRYAAFAKKKTQKKSRIYYLTLDGHEPSPESLEDIPKNQINCISFQIEIEKWISNCSRLVSEKPNLSIIFRQYLKLLSKLTDQLEEDHYMQKIVEMIGESQGSYESAVTISKALTEAKIAKGKAVCSSIVKHIRDAGWEYTASDFDTAIEVWYRSKTCRWPAVVIPAKNGSAAEICFEVGRYHNRDYLTIQYGVRHIPAEEVSLDKLLEFFPSPEWRSIVQKLNIEKIHARWLWRKEIAVDGEIFCLEDAKLYDHFDGIMQKIFAEIDRQTENIQRFGVSAD